MRRWAVLMTITAFAVLVVMDTAPRPGPVGHTVVIGQTAVSEVLVHEAFTADRRAPSATEDQLRARLRAEGPRVVRTGATQRPLLRPGTVLPALTLFGATLAIVRLIERRRA